MLPQYENLRFEIRKLDLLGKNKEAEQKIYDYLKIVKENTIDDIGDDLCFGYYGLSLIRTRLYDYKMAKSSIKQLKKAVRYRFVDEQCIKSLWLMAIYYKRFYFSTHRQIILKYYNICEKYYRLNNADYNLACVLTNKSLITNDIKSSEEALEIYEKLNMNVNDVDDYEGLLENCIEVYLNNNYYGRAMRLLHRITNKELYEELRDKIRNQTPIKMVVDI